MLELLLGILKFLWVAKPDFCLPLLFCFMGLLVLGWVLGSTDNGSQSQRHTWDLRHKRNEDFWRGLEHGIAKALRKKGWTVKVTRGRRDNGADVIASLGTVSFAIEAKMWAKEKNVGAWTVKKVIRGMRYHQCTHAAVIATCAANPAARKYASKAKVLVIENVLSTASQDLSQTLLDFVRTNPRSSPPRKIKLPSGKTVDETVDRGGRCQAMTKKGTQCKNLAIMKRRFCHVHLKANS